MKLVQLIVLTPLLASSTIDAEIVNIEDGRLTVEVSNSEDGYPFKVVGSKFRTGTEAASLLKFIYSNWPDQKPPTLVYDYHTKLDYEGSDVLNKTVMELSRQKNVRVIMMPPATSRIPESWFTARKLIQKHAEQTGAGRPATKPADKPPVKDQPSPPTPKDGPR